MAEGQVIARRFRVTPHCVKASNPDSGTQGEIYILYRVGVEPYTELFMSYYAHVQDWNDDNGNPIVAGSTVYQGDTVGHVGNTGCSGGSHLHYSVARISNNARASSTTKPWRYPYNWNVDVYGVAVGGGHTELPDNLSRINIDPSGWQAPSEMDPRGHAFYNATLTNFGPSQATA